MLALGLIAAAAAVALVTLAVGTQLVERAEIRTSLRRLEGYDLQDRRDQELLEPFVTRTLAPVLADAMALGRSITPAGYLDRVRRKLARAGAPELSAVDRFLVLKILCTVLAPVSAVILLVVVGLGGLSGLLLAGLTALVLFLGPDVLLDRRVERRVRSMQIALPEVIDLLVISVEAGLGFEQALDRVVLSVPGPLSDEFARMLGEVRAGASRSEAMRALEERLDFPEIRTFILAMLQADTFGVSIARVLRTQADELRVRRRQAAQERAQKAPVKMLIPMVFCIFPALFVVVLGPAALEIADNF